MVKSWHKWSFSVGVGKKFVVKRKGGDRGSTFEGLLAVAVHDIFFFCPSKSKWLRRFSSISSIEFGNRTNRTHRKVPFQLCSITKTIEQQFFFSVSFDWLPRRSLVLILTQQSVQNLWNLHIIWYQETFSFFWCENKAKVVPTDRVTLHSGTWIRRV